jgi:hypothetical protein
MINKITRAQRLALFERNDLVSIRGREFIAIEALERLEAEQRESEASVKQTDVARATGRSGDSPKGS